MKFTYNKTEYDINDAFSFKDFTGQSHQNLDKISGVVYGSCFSNETPDVHIFPDNMTGVTFIKCNLMNVFIPAGNTVIDCNQTRFKVQTDLNDWILNPDNTPKEPTDAKIFTKFKLPIPLPQDIPTQKATERIDLFKVAEIKKIRSNSD